MRKLTDLMILAAVLVAGGIGAYAIGHKVDHLSNQAASKDSELQTTTSAGTTVGHASRTHLTPLIVAAVLGGILLAFIAASLISAGLRSRKRERWRAT
ncbi:MAG: hypothetical protein H0X39_18640 [Actinobacteria bacterium]|nr:hypothetical protein [Actinomycetota bacterium]